MGKRFTFLFLFFTLLTGGSLHAQLAPGSISPDFTATDIEGNTWNLYDVLDQGKTVILEITATWDEASWNYHTSQTLQNLYNTYGPNGTDQMMVFFVEGDPDTNNGCLNNEGCNDETQGNWVDGTPFPIIESETIALDFQVTGLPTIYHICPNRVINEIGPVKDIQEIYGFNSSCAPLSGNNNAAVLQYTSFEGIFCAEATTTPAAIFQNMGNSVLTSASFLLSIDGAPSNIENWTGSLESYQIDTIYFDELTFSSDVDLTVSVNTVNGVQDEDTGNNSVFASLSRSLQLNETALTLEYTTDEYPAESFWQILDGNDNVIYSGGNFGIFTGEDSPDTYEPLTTYTFELPLPADGCYRFAAYDRYGDGMCCQYGEGGYVLRDGAGNELFSGSEFEYISDHLFEVKGAAPIVDNARIALYNSERGQYCGPLTFTPQLLIQNVGSNDITSLSIEVSGAGPVQTIEWTGVIAPLEVSIVELNEVSLTTASDLSFALTEVNGVADDYDFDNLYEVSLTRAPVTEYQTVNVHIVTDQYAYEVYWQIHDDSGTIYASGGNENVGPDGGGLRIATDTDPGAYGANEVVDVDVELPAEGCYTFLIVDDYGDGICCEYGNGSFSVSDQDNVVMTEGAQYGNSASADFEVDLAVGTRDLPALGDLAVFPNPARNELTLNFQLAEAMPLQMMVRNALGQTIQTIGDADFSAGRHSVRVDVSGLSDGIYFLSVRNGQAQYSRKFVVSKG